MPGAPGDVRVDQLLTEGQEVIPGAIPAEPAERKACPTGSKWALTATTTSTATTVAITTASTTASEAKAGR
jgi:hypothetical protein